jgi:large-conductance mechanosensitive channel
MSGGKLAARLRAAAMFVWDFVVGDDWRLAVGVVVGLALTALVASSGVVAWWVLPAVVGVLLTLSVWRASDPRH